MNNASLALWLNVSTNEFAFGPFSTSPFFPPLNLIQGQVLTIDVYYVTPSGSFASPWTYNDPATYLTAAGLAIGNQFDYSLYNSTASFTRLVDQYGPKARFVLSIVSNQLNADLSEQGSLIGLLQATWATASTSPSAQLPTVIQKALGAGTSGGVTNAGIQVFPNITSLTAAYPTGLAGIPTINGAVALLTVVEIIGVNTPNVAAQYQLQAYTGSQSLPGIVLPLDANDVSNPVAWIEIQ